MGTEMNYKQINDALTRLHAGIDSAECHGVLSGLLAVADENAQTQWLEHCVPEVEQGDLLAEEALDILRSLYNQVLEQMKSPDFTYQLLLPDDDATLAAQLEAFAHWCQGFLMGISLGGIVDTAKLPGELPGFVEDLLEFTHIGEFDEEDSQDEQACAELIEYARMGALLFHEEIRDLKEAETPDTLH